MKLNALHEDKNLARALKAMRRGPVNGQRISQAAREYGIPIKLLASALSNQVHDHYDEFYRWWSSYSKTVDWPQYRDTMVTPLDDIPIDEVEPPAPPTASAFQAPPNKHMNRG